MQATQVMLAILGLAVIILSYRALYAHARLAIANRRIRHVKRAAERDRKQSRFFRIAGQNVYDGIVVQSMDGIIIWANPAYCRLMGYYVHEMIGRHPLTFALPEAERPNTEEIQAFRYNPDDYPPGTLHLFRNCRKNGELFWNQINLSFLSEDGEDYAVLVCRDVTKQIENDDKLRQTTQELSYIAAHDSLTGAANRAELLNFLGRHALTGAMTSG